MIDRTEPVPSIKKIEEKIEYTLFKMNELTEQMCLLLLDNKSEMRKAQGNVQPLRNALFDKILTPLPSSNAA